MVECVRRYSKLPELTIPTQLARSEPRVPDVSHPPRQVRRRLSYKAVTQVIADYEAGQTTRELATRYDIGKTAITRLLHQHGVQLRHQGLDDEQVSAAMQLYGSGKSVAQVATTLGLHPSPVYDALKRAGIVMRDPHQPGRRS